MNSKKIVTSFFVGIFALLTVSAGVTSADSHCTPTGVGSLTANYVNEVPTVPFDVTCDVGIFFNEDGVINAVEVNGTTANAKSVQYGIYVHDAQVNVTNSTVAVEATYPHQFVSLTYRNGATGTISGNEMTGAHRAAMVIRGADTSVTIKDNQVTGTGPQSTGWAENGIQIDQGASATVTNNVISNHWWNLDNFVSSGLLINGAGTVNVHHNTLRNNDAAVYLIDSNQMFSHNTIEVTFTSATIEGIYGVIVFGDNNSINQNTITSGVEKGAGMYIAGDKNKLIRNIFSGWEVNVYDDGTNTKVPKPFSN